MEKLRKPFQGVKNIVGGHGDVLNALPDKRDNRGKRHSLTFLVATVVFQKHKNRG